MSCVRLSTIISTPDDRDVLFGRGNSVKCHPGNVYFRSLVAEAKPEWEATPRFEKTAIAEQIVDSVTCSTPGSDTQRRRFLKHDKATGQWHEASREEALNKTKKALRERSKKHADLTGLSSPSSSSLSSQDNENIELKQNVSSPCSVRKFTDTFLLPDGMDDMEWIEISPPQWDNNKNTLSIVGSNGWVENGRNPASSNKRQRYSYDDDDDIWAPPEMGEEMIMDDMWEETPPVIISALTTDPFAFDDQDWTENL